MIAFSCQYALASESLAERDVEEIIGFGNDIDESYYEFVRPVLKNLLTAMGKTDIKGLTLTIINDNHSVAYINAKGIHISTKFIDLCKTMEDGGDDALAYVLAHELGHQEKDHFFALKFGSAYANSEWGEKIMNSFGDINQMGILETEADEFGLFFSYSAGYNTLEIAEQVIDKIYETFNLPDQMVGYPPKDFRKKQAAIARQNVNQLIPVFEIGNFLNLLAANELGDSKRRLLHSSRKCYHHILNEKITTIEMYNNLGVSYLNEALSLKRFLFALPTELDFYTRMYIKGQSGVGAGPGGIDNPPVKTTKELFNEALEQAARYFEKCIQLDRDYIKAYNNLAATNLLWQEFDEAFAKSRKALRLAKKNEDKIGERNAIDMLALVHFFLEEEQDSYEYLELSKEMQSPIYAINHEFVKGYHNSGLGFDPTRTADLEINHDLYIRPEFDSMETVNGQLLYDIAYNMLGNEEQDESWYLGIDKAEIAKKEIDGHPFYIYSNLSQRGRSAYYSFYFVDNDAKKSTRLQIKLGDSSERVLSKYQKPAKIISGNQHDYWVYFNHNIIFRLNAEGKVASWIFYDVE